MRALSGEKNRECTFWGKTKGTHFSLKTKWVHFPVKTKGVHFHEGGALSPGSGRPTKGKKAFLPDDAGKMRSLVSRFGPLWRATSISKARESRSSSSQHIGLTPIPTQPSILPEGPTMEGVSAGKLHFSPKALRWNAFLPDGPTMGAK